MKVEEIPVGMPFFFVGLDTVYISRGGGWYSTPQGYDGGPWVDDGGREAFPAPTTLHSHSFDGLDNEELDVCRRRVFVDRFFDHTTGDRALVQYEFTQRGLDWRMYKTEA